MKLIYRAGQTDTNRNGSIEQVWLAAMITGPLVDRVVMPRVENEADAMGAVLIGAGVLLVASSALVYALPAIRQVEADLPDYGTTIASLTGDD